MVIKGAINVTTNITTTWLKVKNITGFSPIGINENIEMGKKNVSAKYFKGNGSKLTEVVQKATLKAVPNLDILASNGQGGVYGISHSSAGYLYSDGSTGYSWQTPSGSGYPAGNSGDIQTNKGAGSLSSIGAGTGVLKNDGANSFSWVTIPSPGGSYGYIQYNDGMGGLSGIDSSTSGFLYNNAGSYYYTTSVISSCSTTTQDVMYSPSTSSQTVFIGTQEVCFYDYNNNQVCIDEPYGTATVYSLDSYSTTTITYVYSCS